MIHQQWCVEEGYANVGTTFRSNQTTWVVDGIYIRWFLVQIRIGEVDEMMASTSESGE